MIPGLYANDINSHPTPAGRCLTLICICSRVIGNGMERNEEGFGFVVSAAGSPVVGVDV